MVTFLNSVGVVLLFVCGAVGEFRFCHFGPQRIKNSDCPYGLFFDGPISTPCAYYANDGTGPSAEAELSTCKGSAKALSSSGERADSTSFRAVFMDVADPNEKGDKGKLANDCVEECFDQWVPLEERGGESSSGVVVETEPFYDYKVPPLLEWDVHFQNNLTAQVFLELLDDDDENMKKDPKLSYIRSVTLLKQSFEIMRKVCEPYINKEFMDQLYKGFLFMVSKSKEEVLDIGELEKTEILKALKTCSGKKDGVKIFGNVCNNYTRIIGYGKPGSDVSSMTRYKILDKSFRWLKYDPIVEGTWAAIDFVHGYCFNDHLPDFNYHHIYQFGLEALFTKTILQRWPYPPKLKRGPGYWNNILDTRDAKLMMQNMDACAQAAYFESAHEKRLNRPFSKFPQLFGDPGKKTTTTAKPDKKPKHLQNAANYWDWYDKNNALDSYLETVGGACIKTENDLNNFRTQFEHICEGS